MVPTPVDGNPTCESLGLTAADGYLDIKVDPPVNGTYSGITVTFTNDGKDLAFSAGFPIELVSVKGGNEGANVYDYRPNGVNADSGLQTPTAQMISHVNFCVKPKLSVDKTAVTDWDRDWDWSISKSGNDTEVGPFADNQAEGGLVQYTVELTATKTDTYSLGGTITISNPFGVAATIESITDVLTTGTATLGGDCAGLVFPATLAAGATLNCTWSVASPNGTETQNAVTVATSGVVAGGSDSVAISYSLDSETDECVTLADDLFPASLPAQVCANQLDANGKWSTTYTINFADFEGADCGENTNTASFLAKDQDSEGDDSGNDSHTVTLLCADIGGCTLTPGYWKTHADPARKQYDATWNLLSALGPNTLFDGGPATYLQTLNTSPNGNVYYILAHAYIAAQLNGLAGADQSAISSALTGAAAFFAAHTPATAAGLKGGAKSSAIALATTLDNYNNGVIGPGHCDT